ncbi:motility associated factor glycosyltransferase family protein [Peribacillus asahii]|uniref:motility associated factor glycosyltransferase family protein n=1 Tax=Peribacillus asahii TaxID=228899 RepID=UPI00382CE7EE
MMLIDNRNYLRLNHRPLLEKLVQWEAKRERNENVQVELSRKGVPTLKINMDGKTHYIHSKYDPQMEAERLITGINDLNEYNHVLLIGIGLGYHLEELLKKYPDMKFSIYEPNIEVLYQFLSYQNISKQLGRNLKGIFTGTEENDIRHSVQHIHQANSKTFIYTLPVYKKVYEEQEVIVMQAMKDVLKGKQSYFATNVSFQKRWTINSIKNFSTVLKTPNILYDVDTAFFQGKPAIIVAAGPSLSSEFENLKYIKENGLAYIFSVGSAINALIEYGIYPDAACTYDPTELNQFVIQKIKDQNISEIPLIFGSSVGFETLSDYPGKMLHMITSQDTISPRLLDTSQNIDIVFDAPSIAVVTFQLLSQLGCNPIILAGQDLGYQNNQKYAVGIEYDFENNTLTEEEQQSLLTVKDVYGNDIGTTADFNQMREQLEMYIRASAKIEVLNTTKGGAHIQGTEFMSLADVIAQRLNDQTVQNKWLESKSNYEYEFVVKQLHQLKKAEERCEHILQKAFDELRNIDQAVQNRQSKKMEQRFVKFDKEFSKLKKNIFYSGFVEPTVRVQNEILSEESQSIRYEIDVLKKGQLVVTAFGSFIKECYAHLQFVRPYFEEMKEEIEKLDIEKQVKL